MQPSDVGEGAEVDRLERAAKVGLIAGVYVCIVCVCGIRMLACLIVGLISATLRSTPLC